MTRNHPSAPLPKSAGFSIQSQQKQPSQLRWKRMSALNGFSKCRTVVGGSTERSAWELYEWVSTLPPDGLPCWLADHDLCHGPTTPACRSSSRTARSGFYACPARKVHPDYADEKVAMEVAALQLIRRETTIPVPRIEAWVVAAQNPLGLGPCMAMEYIQDGVCLNDLFRDATNGSRLLREDVSDDEMETLYRQVAGFLLQLLPLDLAILATWTLQVRT
ncbi:hypothetical protein VTK73DRAFT_2129 [Phialemonium thermophilum]|uniref:Aminoglycoside phosphotransferase domain-containing protein n=1 Tax=Phialemonium thermophilum TaxID=223376 RepID=A0ABR3VSJ6_9PEZI